MTEMKLAPQVRLGINTLLNVATQARELALRKETPSDELDLAMQKFRYTKDLVCEMVGDYEAGRPRPWAHYAPRIDEEFDE